MTTPLKIGITGNIGSGKSIVSSIFRTMGIPVYDSDTEAKRLMQNDKIIHDRIIKTFGNESYTHEKELNKRYIANIIFNDPTALQKINNIVHPRVKEDFATWSKSRNRPIVAIESAILFESGLNTTVDITIAIHADRETCIERACRRNNTTHKEIEQRLAKQTPSDKIISQSEYTIYNNHNTPLLPQIKKLITEIQNKIL